MLAERYATEPGDPAPLRQRGAGRRLARHPSEHRHGLQVGRARRLDVPRHRTDRRHQPRRAARAPTRGSAAAAGRGARPLSQIADALEVAHSRDAIHQDVKPANVMVKMTTPMPSPTPGPAGRCSASDMSDFNRSRTLQPGASPSACVREILTSVVGGDQGVVGVLEPVGQPGEMALGQRWRRDADREGRRVVVPVGEAEHHQPPQCPLERR